MDEVFALYFSMTTLNAYESTPFHLSLDQLKKKFERCLSSEQIERLRKAEKVFHFGVVEQKNQCSFLKEILGMAILEKVCEVKYSINDREKSYTLQFYDISARFGQWYASAYNFATNRTQVFRCDRITDLVEKNTYLAKSREELVQFVDRPYKGPEAVDFEVFVTKKGVDLFQKENYPSMRLEEVNEQAIIRGFYHPGEEDFISNYFIGYGENVLELHPVELSKRIIEKLEHLREQYIIRMSSV